MKLACFFIAAFLLCACGGESDGPTGGNSQVDTVGYFRELFSSAGKDQDHSNLYLVQVRWNMETGKADTTGERLTVKDIPSNRFGLFAIAEATYEPYLRKGNCWFFKSWQEAGYDCFEAEYDRFPRPAN